MAISVWTFPLIGLGGALGAMARHAVTLATLAWFGGPFPFGTLIVNVLGAFATGLFVAGADLVWSPGAHWRSFLTVGFLGGFTTFSAFALEVVRLGQGGHGLAMAHGLAMTLYAILSVGLSVAALLAGVALIRALAGPGA